jgi:hypothetical protein
VYLLFSVFGCILSEEASREQGLVNGREIKIKETPRIPARKTTSDVRKK